MQNIYISLCIFTIPTGGEETTTTESTDPTLSGSIETFLKAIGPWNGSQPAYGYLPYWKGYTWLETKGTTYPGERFTGMCEGKCPRRYKRYGAVCARNRRSDLKSFRNLCEMFNEDCSGEKGWQVVYRGKCAEETFGLFPTVTIQQHAIDIVSNYYMTTDMAVAEDEYLESNSFDKSYEK